ncbi:hypothetical protein ES695_06150 [Candidatus Atribacteria bacterium 1244-E10-H5-B2]|nr:MAG: hypothetical protein ES695_06150 [Candidatus Atribacteria bacterium 1244-E10-H5-B2]
MLRIKIETKNAAFDGNLKDEVARCLKDVIEKITSPSYAGDSHIEFPIHDVNGNNVGSFKLTK